MNCLMVIGPDGVGKTPIARSLAARTGNPYFKVSVEKEIFHGKLGTETLWFDYLLTQFVEQTGVAFISDRGYPCEWVYGKYFRAGTDLGMLRMIDERHAALGTKILLLYSSTGPARTDELVEAEHYENILQLYREFSRWTHCDVMEYDTSLSGKLRKGPVTKTYGCSIRVGIPHDQAGNPPYYSVKFDDGAELAPIDVYDRAAWDANRILNEFEFHEWGEQWGWMPS